MTSVGADIRNIVKNKDMHPETEMLLFFADRVEHVKSVIIPALNDGKIVISDRFYDSTRAYQGVNYGQENADKVELLIRHFVSDCTPDLTLYLDADPENVLNRAVEVGKFENKDFDFHIKVREAFLNIAKDYSYLKGHKHNFAPKLEFPHQPKKRFRVSFVQKHLQKQ